jgi:type IV secretion system protein VirB9
VSESDIKAEMELKREADLKAERDAREAANRKPPEPEGPVVSEPAKMALRQSQEWAENPSALPTQGKDGRMLFTFGDSAPTIICAPLRVCDIELEPGETVQGAPHIGDSVRWKIAPAVSAEGDQKVTHLIIKPTEPGLDTNLMVPTDRRTYHLRLVSSRDKYLARVAFEYPDNTAPVWQKMMQTSRPDRPATGVAAAGQSDFPNVNIDRMNFNYKVEVVKGKPRFKPVRVMDDGTRTYISMNDDMPVEEAPVLVLVDPDNTEQMVNYRLKGNIFILDRMADKLALISGTGSGQQRIEISRERKCIKRGWFGRCLDGSE